MIFPKTFFPFFQSVTGQFHRWSFNWFWHSLIAIRIAFEIAFNKPGFSFTKRRCFFLNGRFKLFDVLDDDDDRIALTWFKWSNEIVWCPDDGLRAMSLWKKKKHKLIMNNYNKTKKEYTNLDYLYTHKVQIIKNHYKRRQSEIWNDFFLFL